MQNHYSGPVSAKGIVFEDGAVWLRRNERKEWELPGGKVDRYEQPSATVARELDEELGFQIDVLAVVDATMYQIAASVDESKGVIVVSYLCDLRSKSGTFELIGEAGAAEFRAFKLDDVESLDMPSFYKMAIHRAYAEYLRFKKQL